MARHREDNSYTDGILLLLGRTGLLQAVDFFTSVISGHFWDVVWDCVENKECKMFSSQAEQVPGLP